MSRLGFEIISTGGTAKALEDGRIPVTLVSEVTGAPEILGGRVKTLHPKLHGGILANLEDQDHVVELVEHDIAPVDLVCANLYPFEKTVEEDPGIDEKEAIEQDRHRRTGDAPGGGQELPLCDGRTLAGVLQ